MTSTTSDCPGEFLADYTAWMLGCGATCVRIDKNVRRMAEAFGEDIDLTIMPKHVSVALTGPDGGASRIFCRKPAPCGINFTLNAALSALSWEVSDRGLSVGEAAASFRRIIGATFADGAPTCLLVALANASFCRLFGGDAEAMGAVFAATLAGYALKQWLMRRRTDRRAVFFFCAMLSTLICAVAAMMKLGSTPEVAIATSVLYLIPGVPYINSASDLIDGHYLFAFCRFCDALILTAALSLGMVAALSLVDL